MKTTSQSKGVGKVEWFEYDQETKKLVVCIEITDEKFKSRVLHTKEWQDVLTIKGKDVVKKITKVTEVKTAILGGGDIGFPLLFAGVVMKTVGFTKVLIIPVVVSISLFILLYFAEKNKFYPAMPFLSAGCFLGYGLVTLI